MRILVRLLAGVLVLALAAVAVLVLVTEGQPLVPLGEPLTDQQRRWAEQWVRANDPRRRPDGARVSLSLSGDEAGLLANWFVSRLGPGQARVRIDEGALELAASVGLPWNPTGAFLNLQLGLREVDDLPQVPTVAESGYKGFEAATWFGFVAPAGVPKDIVARLNTEFNKALQTADVKKKLSDQGADVMGGSPEQFGALIKSEIARWAPLIKESGAKLD